MPRFYIGTMGWNYSFWKDSFYPANLPSKQFLSHYATQFNTVEVDSTFYRIPRISSVVEWYKQTPKDFMFSLKFPQIITHIKKLKDCREETKVFLERTRMLKEKLGALLVQLPSSFGSDEDFSSLGDFLKDLPKGHRYALEIRNRKLLNNSFYSLLRNNNTALALVESPFLPQIGEITADFVYVRWEGDRKIVKGILSKREVEKSSNIKAWAEKLKQISPSKKEVFGYFSKYYSGNPTIDARDLLQNLGAGKNI